MSLLCFASDFALDAEEKKETQAITNAAFGAWCLVNDYFSFDKEWKNHMANDPDGKIVSSVFLFMEWYQVDIPGAKKLLRAEIIRREKLIVQKQNALIGRGALTPRISEWFYILDTVTAGNFAWSMTTARYHASSHNPYSDLRKEASIARGGDVPQAPAPATVSEQEGASMNKPSPVVVSKDVDASTNSDPSSPTSEKTDQTGDDASTNRTSISPSSDCSPSDTLSDLGGPKPEQMYSSMEGPALESYSKVRYGCPSWD